MKKKYLSLFVGAMLTIGSTAGAYTLDIEKGWNLLGAKTDIIAEEISKNKNITEIRVMENGEWINWKSDQKDSKLKVIFANTGFLVKSKEDVTVDVSFLDNESVSIYNNKVKFKIPVDSVSKFYIDDELLDLSQNQSIKIDKNDSEHFTIIIPIDSEYEGMHNFMVETKNGTSISKDLEVKFSKSKTSRAWTLSNSYGYCGSKANSITKYISDWVVDLYRTGKGNVYIGDSCKRHDQCYANQWGKNYCDSRFYSDMKDDCRSKYNYNPKNWRERASMGACLYKTWIYYNGVKYGGKSAYGE